MTEGLPAIVRGAAIDFGGGYTACQINRDGVPYWQARYGDVRITSGLWFEDVLMVMATHRAERARNIARQESAA
jgi:hypothetical protein